MRGQPSASRRISSLDAVREGCSSQPRVSNKPTTIYYLRGLLAGDARQLAIWSRGMSHYYTRWCEKHGDWDDDVDNPSEGCPQCIGDGSFKTRSQLEGELS